MQLHPLKLVTIVAEQILKEQLIKKGTELGATGCTYFEAEGTGSRGARSEGISSDFTGSNVRIEFICPQSVADAIMTYVSHHYFENYACIAWVSDVSVVRGERYLKHGS